ncbi:MBL fold metallo-hydrolase [Thalassomonas haliotis]|uniref:MBL fold metallo-hydrolase n=1 Tax=Thalassomonas haliotis TaxID=485448 RepID=A0ABY7VFS0_9GAMM|nr:MBL fold metallo-hydrolase [Thalassomonas haliotis]WDE12559.1 MBL fold metallo-hydrolase [Thalassomonas haliotis]
MILTFYGVRGSVPAPGSHTIKYGGNTPCIHLDTGEDFHLVLDAGTGIIPLGEQLLNDNKPIYLLLSHNHWDHIQGFPFFKPAYQKNRQIHILPGLTRPMQPQAILKQMAGSLFPVASGQLAADIRVMPSPAGHTPISIGQLTISRKVLNHPGGGSAYLIDNQKQRFAYITDNELFPPGPVNTSLNQWQEFTRELDLLIHDAQYFPDDFPAKSGWGHTCYESVIDLAIAARIRHLCLFSHDHCRSDNEIEQMLARVHQEIQRQQSTLEVFAAREQSRFILDSHG